MSSPHTVRGIFRSPESFQFCGMESFLSMRPFGSSLNLLSWLSRFVWTFVWSAVFAVLAGCGGNNGDTIPGPLLERIQNAAPNKGTATPLALNGPFRRSVRKIANG